MHSGIVLHRTGRSLDCKQSFNIVQPMLEQGRMNKSQREGFSSNTTRPSVEPCYKKIGFASSHSASNIYVQCACDHTIHKCTGHAIFIACMQTSQAGASQVHPIPEANSTCCDEQQLAFLLCQSGAQTQTLGLFILCEASDALYHK